MKTRTKQSSLLHHPLVWAAVACVTVACGDESDTQDDGAATDGAMNEGPDDADPTTDGSGGSSEDPDPSGDDSAGDSGDSDDSGSTGDGEDTTADGSWAIEGVVGRLQSVGIWEGNDGIGTLYVTALAECTVDAAPLAATAIEDADFSDAEAEIPFLLEDLPDGTFHVTAFLDDDGDADPAAPAPDQGDFILSSGTSVGCVEVTVSGADATDVVVAFNLALPF